MMTSTQFLPLGGGGPSRDGGGVFGGAQSGCFARGHCPSVTPLARHLPLPGRNFL